MTQDWIKKNIVITSMLLIFAITIFQITDLDIFFQNLFFDFNTSTWIWNKDESISKFILYDGIKGLLIGIAFLTLMFLLIFRKKTFLNGYKKGLFLFVLASIIIPTVVGTLKATTNTPCPKNIEHFGGNYPDIKVFDSYPKDFVQEKKIKCWPAGHASGGFTLLSLFFLFKKRKNQYLALTGALIIGWAMGTYKMLIGDHFLSHTIITMLIAWLIVLLLKQLLDFIERKMIEKST